MDTAGSSANTKLQQDSATAEPEAKQTARAAIKAKRAARRGPEEGKPLGAASAANYQALLVRVLSDFRCSCVPASSEPRQLPMFNQ